MLTLFSVTIIQIEILNHLALDAHANATSMLNFTSDRRDGAQDLLHNHAGEERCPKTLPGLVPAPVPEHTRESESARRHTTLHMRGRASNQRTAELGPDAALGSLWMANEVGEVSLELLNSSLAGMLEEPFESSNLI